MKLNFLKLIIIISCLSLGQLLTAQSNLAIGQWKQFLPFKTSQYVTGGEGDIYYSTGTAIVIVHEDRSIEYLSKIEGLSGVNIGAIHYNNVLNVLVVGYEDGNVDLIYEDGIVNINDIVLNTNIQVSLSIKSIYTDEEGVVYLSTDFGVVILDIVNDLIETIFTPSPANQVAQFEDYLYLALDDGIYRTLQLGNSNLVDFSLWEFFGSSHGAPSSYFSKGIASFNGDLFADINGDLFKINDEVIEVFNDETNFNINFLYAGHNYLYAGFQCMDGADECSGKIIGVSEVGNIVQANRFCSTRPRYVYEDDEGTVWLADDFNILYRAANLGDYCTTDTLNTIGTDGVRDVKVIDDVLYVAAGGADQNFTPDGNRRGTAVLKDGRWIEYGSRSSLTTLSEDDSRDHVLIRPHPSNGKIYIATAWSGVVEYDPESFTFLTYGEDNSPLRRALGDNGRPRVFGIDFDSQENLWVINYNTLDPLHVLLPDGSWQSFSPTSENDYFTIIVDHADNKWIAVEDQSISFIIFNEGDMSTSSDDLIRRVTSSNSELDNPTVESMAVDRDGAVWVGTEQGVVVFNCGDPFDDNCTGSRPKVLKDGFLAFLLENETINTIAIDPANRKWFGTNNGIFVQSPSGDEELFHFTEDNSPLLTDRVIEIEVDPKTGIVYIGTEKGLIAYKSDAIQGEDFHASTIRAYPNPVEPGYTGSIAIVGFANESSVKIANINGQIVNETEALGGQAIWDGRDFSGRRVSSGVYFAFGASNSFFGDADGAIAKILFLH